MQGGTMNEPKLRSLLQSIHKIVNPGEYGLGTEPDSLTMQDKEAWEQVGKLLDEAIEVTSEDKVSDYKNYEDAMNELASEVEEFISRHTDHPEVKMTAIGSRLGAIARDMLDRTIPIADDDTEYYSLRVALEHRILSLVIYRSFRPAKEVT